MAKRSTAPLCSFSPPCIVKTPIAKWFVPPFTNLLTLSLGCCPEVAVLCTVCLQEKRKRLSVPGEAPAVLGNLIWCQKLSLGLSKGRFIVAVMSLVSGTRKIWVCDSSPLSSSCETMDQQLSHLSQPRFPVETVAKIMG